MHNLLIIFVVLLVLLVLISTLGGSIYPKEMFVDEEKVREMFWDGNVNTASPMSSPPASMPTAPKVSSPPPAPAPSAHPPPPPSAPPKDKPEHFQQFQPPTVEAFEGDVWASV